MKNKEKKSLPEFEAISSAPYVSVNFLVGFTISFILVAMPVLLIFLLFYSFDEKGLDGAVFFVFLFTILVVGIIIYAISSGRKKAFTTTIIDEKGIRYYNKFTKTIIKDLPWTCFVKNKELTDNLKYPVYDIWSRTESAGRGKSFFEKFFWKVSVDNKTIFHKDLFNSNHIFCVLYSNRLELIRTFLLGVAHYRPDIVVDPHVFCAHYIDPETYVIDYEQKSNINIVGTVICVIIMVVVYFIVF